jgi:hypothetical protein
MASFPNWNVRNVLDQLELEEAFEVSELLSQVCSGGLVAGWTLIWLEREARRQSMEGFFRFSRGVDPNG